MIIPEIKKTQSKRISKYEYDARDYESLIA